MKENRHANPLLPKAVSLFFIFVFSSALAFAQRTTEKPVLHGNHWLAITGNSSS